MIGNNANTSLTFTTEPRVRSAEELLATRREMVPGSFPFPSRVALAFDQCALAESEGSPVDPIAASFLVRRPLRHPLPHLNESA